MLKETLIKMTNTLMKKIFFALAIISTLMIIAFSIVAIWNWTLLIGFITGLIAAVISFIFNAFSAKLMFSKKRGKRIATLFGVARITFQLTWYVICVLAIIAIDSYTQGYAFGKGGTQSLFYPIHFLTFIVGISMVAISIFVVHIPSFFKRKPKESEDGQNN